MHDWNFIGKKIIKYSVILYKIFLLKLNKKILYKIRYFNFVEIILFFED